MRVCNQVRRGETERHTPYLFFVLLLSLMALVVLSADVFVDDNSETGILGYADTLLCVLFFGDFLVCLSRTENKAKYLFTWGWLDLISSVPAIDVLRWGRAARLARVLRVLRGVRSARVLVKFPAWKNEPKVQGLPRL